MKNFKAESDTPGLGTRRQKDLSDRLLEFAAATIKLTYDIPRTNAGKHIGLQLIRSATSIGANYEEGCAAQSRADFIHKLQISLKEARETVYWMRLLERLELIPNSNLEQLTQEGKEISLILAKSLVTTKGIE